MERIPIVLSTNDNYSAYAGTVIKSAVLNTSSELFFAIFSNGLSKENIVNLKACAAPYELKIFEIELSQFSNFCTNLMFKHITVETCFRYVIADLLPEFAKAIYLDCDTLVLDDISKLFSLDISEYYLAAVNERPKLKNPYFNAGVILFNCDKIRAENITPKLFERTKELNGKSKLLDQDTLNDVFNPAVKYISPRWNLEPPVYGRNRLLTKDEKISIINSAGIIHFSGPNKPWITPEGISSDPFTSAFFYYLRQTPYAHLEKICKARHNKFVSFFRYIYRTPFIFFKSAHHIRSKFRKINEAKYNGK